MSKSTEILSFDWAAKYLLRDKANFVILEGLVSTILGQNIHIDELLESESNQRYSRDKYNRVDIKAKDEKGDIIIVEIQLSRELYFIHRILYSVAKTITDHINLKQRYEAVQKVYSINILYFDFGKGNDYLYHGQNNLIGVNTGDTLLISSKEENGIKMVTADTVFPEYYLLRVSQFNGSGNSPIEQWMRYLKDGIINENTKVPGLAEAAERLAYIKMSREEQIAYENYLFELAYEDNVIAAYKIDGIQEGLTEGREEGLKVGREEGREEGRMETNLNNAKKMKELGVDLDIIYKTTGLRME